MDLLDMTKPVQLADTATGAALTDLDFEFTWEASGGTEKGLFAKLKGAPKVDMDATVAACKADNGVIGAAWYKGLKPFDGAITHHGDKAGRGTSLEKVTVDLLRLPTQVSTLIFCLSSYHGADYSQLNSAVLRIFRNKPQRELIAENYLTITSHDNAAVLATVKRTPNGWFLQEHDIFGRATTWQALAALYTEALGRS